MLQKRLEEMMLTFLPEKLKWSTVLRMQRKIETEAEALHMPSYLTLLNVNKELDTS